MNRKEFLKMISATPFLFPSSDLTSFNAIAENFSSSPKMPVLFLGHGSPMNAIEENSFVNGFRNIAKEIPTPSAILCISAHWYTNGTYISTSASPRTIHDFGGFPKALYDIQYPAKGQPTLAEETRQLLTPFPVESDPIRGLDHGAWTVLMHLYPLANIPVIQLSIDYTKAPEYHFQLAQQLQSLREKGVLIVGSGNIIHHLGLVDFQNLHKENYGYEWAQEANEIFHQKIDSRDFKALIQYKNLGSASQLAIPTPDHYLPMIYSLALMQANEPLQYFNDQLLGGSLSMTSFKIGG